MRLRPSRDIPNQIAGKRTFRESGKGHAMTVTRYTANVADGSEAYLRRRTRNVRFRAIFQRLVVAHCCLKRCWLKQV